MSRWLGLLEDGSVVQAIRLERLRDSAKLWGALCWQANGFSKGAHAIARFHALGSGPESYPMCSGLFVLLPDPTRLKLQMPHWYANAPSSPSPDLCHDCHDKCQGAKGQRAVQNFFCSSESSLPRFILVSRTMKRMMLTRPWLGSDVRCLATLEECF